MTRATVKATDLDHIAVATRVLADGWDLFGGVLGGRWVYGGDDPGFWWGQLSFTSGPKIELLTPTGGTDGAFLERFLASRGPGPHHLNFSVADIRQTLARVRALGIEPVKVSLASPAWREAFLHPRDAYGIVIQVAQSSGPPPQHAAPSRLAELGAPCDLALVELRVDDIDGAIRLYAEALDGEIAGRHDTAAALVAELTWQDGARLRLVQSAAAPSGATRRTDSGLACLRFTRSGPAFSPAERDRARDLSRRLGVSLDLDSRPELQRSTSGEPGPARG